MAFAAMLSRQRTTPGRCPYINLPVQEKAVFPIHDNEGKLLSTIALDIDNTQNMSDLNSANQYIENLEKKLAHLSAIKEGLQDEANTQLPSPLSQREIQVLQLLACGTTNVEIAQSLNISPHTVKSHINHIFNKLAVNSRTQASVWATQNHFV
ncbi:MAG: response regulator transcription factor [Desulfobacter sp.]|nr:response regulator transcription factor [Desulfobacter sp.]WDP87843.1 MAG: response regulator transcription factor [Desulfobacter sp.]